LDERPSQVFPFFCIVIYPSASPKDHRISMRKALASAIGAFRTTICYRWYKSYIVDSVQMIRHSGFKVFFRRRGWKIITVVILYYLIRDSVLYILLPYLVARQIL
jgi:hypothetical protein